MHSNMNRFCLRPVLRRLALAAFFTTGLTASPGALAQLQETPRAIEIPAAPSAPAQPGAISSPIPAVPATAPQAAPSVASAALPRDLSPWGMFLAADIVVKAIMLGLVFASFLTWTIWLAKTLELSSAKRRAKIGVRLLGAARSLGEANQKLTKESDAVTRLVRTAVAEVQASPDASAEALKERVAWLLQRVEIGAGRRAGRGMGLLATIGATAPFVGLFGTVWGIMNSFIGISNAQTTNLAVVAPGIAEALLATALGLFAAIPAVVIYNIFARSIAAYRSQLADAGALVMRLVSRDCDATGYRSGALSRAAE
jgi:biopolymer transport protein ExbB